MSLAEMHCEPCKHGEGLLTQEEVTSLMVTVPGWKLSPDNKHISLRLTFPDFKTSLVFVNRVGELAETEDHHPDIYFGWGFVECTLTTHSAKGLTRNDFIVASKIDVLAS